MRQTCHEVLDVLGLHDDPLLKMALELEKIALEDEYFIKKKLYPNDDFYSGIVLRAHASSTPARKAVSSCRSAGAELTDGLGVS